MDQEIPQVLHRRAAYPTVEREGPEVGMWGEIQLCTTIMGRRIPSAAECADPWQTAGTCDTIE